MTNACSRHLEQTPPEQGSSEGLGKAQQQLGQGGLGKVQWCAARAVKRIENILYTK